MANQAFTKVNNIAAPIDNLIISNNLSVGGITLAGPIEKTLIVPAATAPPDADNLIQITAQQSGTTFILSQTSAAANDQVLVLPPAAIGLNYTFIVQNVTNGSEISIMPYGYTHAGKNPTTTGGVDTNGVAEAYAFGIQIMIDVGAASGGYVTGAVSESVNTVAGDGTSIGGILFTTAMVAAPMLKLTCVSTSTTGDVLTGCRWIGNGHVSATQDIDVTA